MPARKPRERARARELRCEEGMPYKRIAALLDVSPSSVVNWTRDIELTPEQRHRNLYGPRGPQNPEHIAARVARWAETARAKRRKYQLEGHERARDGDLLHMGGCMLYWAEGSKSRNTVTLSNSDPGLMRFFCRFLREAFGFDPGRFVVRLNVYTNNGLSIDEIEDHWLHTLDLPRSCLRKHTLNHLPTSSSGRRRKLPYGVCSLSVTRSTRIVQHIYGAIQEYGGFEEPRWLDC
jgi:transposase-like protein